MAKQLKITLIKSTIGSLKKQKATIEALGLSKIGSSKIHNDNPCLQGQIKEIQEKKSAKKAKAPKADAEAQA